MRSEHIEGSKVGITIAVMLAALMSVLDISIVNVALSDIRASFGTPLDQIAWVSTGYMMANVVVIPMTGWLQRKFGYRRYFTFSILLFTAASVLCGLSWNLPSLVAFRILQGVGGGAIIPTSQAILFARYPQEEHGMAGALFGLGAITGPLLGPTLGGYLIEWASWHWIFLINVPVGLLAASMAWKEIKQPYFEPTREKVDTYGIGLLAVGMATLQYTLEEGNREGWFDSVLITVTAAIAAISLITFIVHELEAPHPVVDLRVFANRSYSAATGLNFLTGTALFSASFLFSLYAGTVMRYSALDIGLLFLKGSAIQVAIMPLVGRFGNKVDGRYLIGFGVLMMCWSLWTNAHLTAQSSNLQMMAPIFIRACGLGFLFVPLSVFALSGLPAHQRGNGAGLYNLTRELGGSIGTAWMSSALDRRTKLYHLSLGEHVDAFNQYAQEQLRMLQGAFTGRVADPFSAALQVLNQKVSAQSLIRAFNDNFEVLTFLFALSLVLIFMLKKPVPGVKIEGAH
ncbi:DHA2 family efflux MFS transporter permease subunit [Aggregicoccus sp. 17bor-14]|uniref:DHA2 family efflux MFS transporter permease subunit n=1 Tax=Myxococcaceae TaxID=31 RepID=UPI00129C1926|nr:MULTISPECIES: DHA2 family efflux MFS transporter permease subunit [Myxococcaceae]MBF5042222.1 DHA2 family efflux MFS transporter permease subunit [Simulacricoccus sp. 17bor-14]MRI87998.1 DHA2 family efflux MFS transporter permease subunit [Aggregicoccus sp. 17bor-14]